MLLIGEVFLPGLLHIFQEIDAGDPQAHIAAEFFGHQPFMLQNLGPQIRGSFRLQSGAAALKYFSGRYFRR